MRESLLARVRCVECGGALRVARGAVDGGSLADGELGCAGCGALYPVRRRLPYLLPEGKLEGAKQREAEGWTALWEEKGMYERPTLEDSFRLPYVGGIWTDVGRMFDLALEDMALTGEETVLDLGAGQGWASRYFAARGCTVVAADIVADEWYGLGRAWAIMDHAGVRFDPVIADGETLPFPDGGFDIVFMCGALHHFEQPHGILSEAARVLKPGGRFIAAGEPAISLFSRERDAQAHMDEVRVGIIERRPKAHEYWWSLRRAGLRRVLIDTFETLDRSPGGLRRWIRAVRRSHYAAVRTRYKPVVWLLFTLLLPLPRRAASFLALEANGANLYIRATKPR